MVIVLYATTEGQTGRIAERIAQRLRDEGRAALACPAGDGGVRLRSETYDGVIVGASIHYGRHPAYLRALLRRHRPVLDALPSAFFSVSLSAGGPGARPRAARRYVDKFLKQVGWRPVQTGTFAGAIRYSMYGPFKRALMLLFVGLAGGDTDTSRDHEYTDWAAVDAFAESFARRLSR